MAKTDITYAYAADITKAEKTADGDLLVFGKAAGPELDLDGQICDPQWLKTAMPDWAKWGNVRAQHSAIAAGVGVELEDVGGGAWTLKSLVVDDDSKRKVEKKVYKGYSIGVKNARVVKDAKAPKGRIVGGDIVEISLVDRPANPTATMTLCKMAGGDVMPVDVDGELLEVDDIDKAALGDGPLSPDLIKAALSTVDGVLHGDLIKSLEESGDVDGAKAAIRQMAMLVQSEARALAAGDLSKTLDITRLVEATRALECFVEDDEDEDGYAEMADDVAAYKAALADEEDELVERVLLKVAARTARKPEADDAPDEPDDEGENEEEEGDDEGEGDTYKAARADAATLVEAEITKAVAKATAPLEAELQVLRADLAKAMAAPRSGGPVLITQPTTPTLGKSAEADRLIAIADRTADPELSLAYRQAAAKKAGVAA